MAEKVNDGGPAFPNITPDMPVDGGPGMSLRDYFAAKALTGLMDGGWQNDGNPFGNDRAHRTAVIAYQFADAMLKARSSSVPAAQE